MEENQNINTEIMTNEEMIAEIQNLKANTVSIEKYNKLAQEKSELFKALLNGEVQEKEEGNRKTVDELQKELIANGHKLNNLEYATLACDLRDAVIARDGEDFDPFVVTDEMMYKPSKEDYEGGKNTYDALRECIDYADGNSAVFTQELTRRMGGLSRRR